MTSEAALPIALLLDEQESERFERERPAVRGLLALTPGAWGALSAEHRALLVADPLTDRAHARITARARRAARQFEAVLAEAEARPGARPLHHGTRHQIAYTLQQQVFTIARAWELLGGSAAGPWLIPSVSAGWQRHDERAAAHAAFLQHLRERHPLVANAPQSGLLFRLLRGLVLRLIRDRGPWLMTTRIRLVYGLDRLIRRGERPPRIFALDPRGSGIFDYLQLWRLLRDGLGRAPAVKLPMASPPKRGVAAPVAAALDAVEDPVVRRGLAEPLRGFLLEETGCCEGLYEDALAVTRSLRPLHYISRQDSGRMAAIADAAGGAGVPRTVINYNSFPHAPAGVASHLLRFFFNARMPETLSDHFVMWSPHLARLSREVYGPEARAATRPLRLVPTAIESMTRAPGPYRVLHASNFTEWVGFFPWIMETSLEFVADILALERVCDSLDEVELTIRTKPKSEGNPTHLRRLLPPETRAVVTGTKRAFSEALAEADMMVGFGSTTIEEAMLSRKPVLLWGPTRRFMQLQARATPPRDGDRAAVYVAHERAELGPMIVAILEAHSGRPLTDAEIAEHVWPEGTPTVEDLARRLTSTAEPAPAARSAAAAA